MVKVILEGNKKDVEVIKRILDDYLLISFCMAEKPLFNSNTDTRQTLKVKMPSEMWEE